MLIAMRVYSAGCSSDEASAPHGAKLFLLLRPIPLIDLFRRHDGVEAVFARDGTDGDIHGDFQLGNSELLLAGVQQHDRVDTVTLVELPFQSVFCGRRFHLDSVSREIKEMKVYATGNI
ncbi:hypothetical protein [Janthinobacterium sp.]|uniref:hypothetical protein n=1 Tax=Janthinobacterium sp. TaxID=1871054 RepID=UPI00258AFA8C|nr:hypothetical protein [Janthinobacterium sp.]MCX7290188.1 hypothetical protein [Janthinobacterium sp.]